MESEPLMFTGGATIRGATGSASAVKWLRGSGRSCAAWQFSWGERWGGGGGQRSVWRTQWNGSSRTSRSRVRHQLDLTALTCEITKFNVSVTDDVEYEDLSRGRSAMAIYDYIGGKRLFHPVSLPPCFCVSNLSIFCPLQRLTTRSPLTRMTSSPTSRWLMRAGGKDSVTAVSGFSQQFMWNYCRKQFTPPNLS